MPDIEEAASSKIKFSNLKSQKRKDPSKTPNQESLVPGTEVVRPGGVLDMLRLPKRKEPKHIIIVHVTSRVPSGIVKDLVMDLLFPV
jgi:hypothetical protein